METNAARLRNRILLSEAIFVFIFWLLALFAPYLFAFTMRETLGDMVYHVPFDLSLLVSSFSLWLNVTIMKFHQDLLLGLSLDFKWFTPSVVPTFIPIVARLFVSYVIGWKLTNDQAEIQHAGYVVSIYKAGPIRSFSKLHDDIKRPDTGLPSYAYKNLQKARSFRVLQLNPSNSDTAPLVGSIKEEDLDFCSPFEALSYAWDDEKGDGHIICDGAILRVSKNCAAALRRIRIQAGRKRTRLWVDAICINQKAPEEKERQLAIMGEIYKKAANVIVWLGEHDQSSSRVLEFFEAVAKSYESERRWSKTTKKALLMIRRWRVMSEALAQFFNRSWFTRMWPIQEVTLPQRGRVQMLCGTTKLPFEYLRFGWDVLKDLGVLPTAVNLDQAVALQFYIADALDLKRNERRVTTNTFRTSLITNMSEFSLCGVMNATRYKACKYPKDKFFALYGVFQELGISFDITPSMYNKYSDSEIMKAVMLACLKYDGNLDALRLGQLASPYLSSSDFIGTRQDPYDSFSTAVFGMTGRLGCGLWNVCNFREFDYTAGIEWRNTLPSWVPDWTQWTRRNLDPIRDIRFLQSYSSVFVQVSNPVKPMPIPKLLPASGDNICGICSSETGCIGITAHYHISGSNLTLEAKIVGSITNIGSVDSVAVIWQVLLPDSEPFLSRPRIHITQWIYKFCHGYPDPALSALVETMINFVWRSRMAQAFISLRMAVRTLGLRDIISYIGAVAGVGWTGPWVKELLCMRHSSIASCPTDGFTMRAQSKRGGYAEVQFIATMFNNLLNGRKPWNSDMWYDLTGTTLAALSYLLWDCRVSIAESLFGGKYEEMDWWILAPLYVYIMSSLVQSAASLIGDTVFVLLGQAVTALSGIWGLFVFLVWAKIVTIPVLVIFGVRACYKPPWRVLSGVFGSEEFRPADAYTPGMHFFSTNDGSTGNTSGPVQTKDLLVMVRGCCDYLILRPKGKGFVVVGSAYVGTMAREMLGKDDSEWSEITLQ